MQNHLRFITGLILMCTASRLTALPATDRPSGFRIEPHVMISGIASDYHIRAVDENGLPDREFDGQVLISGFDTRDGDTLAVFTHGGFMIGQAVPASGTLECRWDGGRTTLHLIRLPWVLAFLPPLLAILLAILLRQVIIALFVGIWAGAFMLAGYQPLESLHSILDHYLIDALAHPDHAAIVIFSMTLGGMAGIITRNGGT
ncbi:hypothetical protein JW948_09290, partial [bacterium]|nr:hypothetical protein [bacterium]